MSGKSAKKISVKQTSLPKLGGVKSLSKYDLIDLGAGDGASLVNFEKKIGGKGLGIEFSKQKVAKAAGLGRNVVYGNALNLHKTPGKADIVTCDNFLEHLLSNSDAEKMLEQAVKAARKLVYIRHPSFEDNEYLAGLGLKTYWSDWRGHTSMLKVSEIVDMLRRQGIQTFKIIPVLQIKDSDDTRIIPLSAPTNQHHYEAKHGRKPKPAIKFDHEVYYAFDIVAVIPGAEDYMPELIYTDRKRNDSRPRFSFENSEKIAKLSERITELSNEAESLKNRRAVKSVDWVKQKTTSAKNRIKPISRRRNLS
jgi:hypothetical protein